MANVRLNQFNNFPHFFLARSQFNANTLMLHHVYIPGSLSFNNAVMLLSQGHTSASATISFGLYSNNNSTLSLANSASASFNTDANGAYWLTLNTSAAQDISPGDWYLGFLQISGGNNSITLFIQTARTNAATMDGKPYGGPFFRGWLSASTDGLPSSIATTDLSKEVGSTSNSYLTYSYHPYILISS